MDFKPGEKLPYTCGNCHTTGYSNNGNQDGLPGIQGQWEFPGVQCEACHGPGSLHVDSEGDVAVESGRDTCRKCHSTEPFDKIPMTDVFLSPYTEYNQLSVSPHKGIDCVQCHDPHFLSGPETAAVCRDCHEGIWVSYKDSFTLFLQERRFSKNMFQNGIISFFKLSTSGNKVTIMIYLIHMHLFI